MIGMPIGFGKRLLSGVRGVASRGMGMASGLPGRVWGSQIGRSAIYGAGIGMGGQVGMNLATGNRWNQGMMGAGVMGGLGGAGYGIYRRNMGITAARGMVGSAGGKAYMGMSVADRSMYNANNAAMSRANMARTNTILGNRRMGERAAYNLMRGWTGK